MPSTACGGDLTRRPLAAVSPSPFCASMTGVSSGDFVASPVLHTLASSLGWHGPREPSVLARFKCEQTVITAFSNGWNAFPGTHMSLTAPVATEGLAHDRKSPESRACFVAALSKALSSHSCSPVQRTHRRVRRLEGGRAEARRPVGSGARPRRRRRGLQDRARLGRLVRAVSGLHVHRRRARRCLAARLGQPT